MSQKEIAGYYASIESYNGEGTQSLSVTNTINSNSKSVFFNENEKTKQIIHGHSLSELTISGNSKSAFWGGVQVFSIDDETDCIGDLYLCLTVKFNKPDTPLDSDLSPKTITTLLQKPSSRDALTDSSKREKKGWYIRGVSKGDTHPKPTYIGFPNGWKHLFTDVNDLGSGYRFGDGGMDAVDNYGLPTEAVSLPGVWGVTPDSAPRAQAWEEIQDVLKKDKDLFVIQDFDCKDVHLDPSVDEKVIYQRDKGVSLGEYLIQEQGRTASNCYDVNSHFINSLDRTRSFNIMQSYYHNGIKNKFKDEYTNPSIKEETDFTVANILNDQKLKDIREIDVKKFYVNSGSNTEQYQISATFPNTVTVSDLQSKSSSYCSTLETTMNTIGVDNNFGTWSGNISSIVVNTVNKNWDYWIGRDGADTSVIWSMTSSIVSNLNNHPQCIESLSVEIDNGQPVINTELLDMYCVNLSNVFSTYTMNENLNSVVVNKYNNWPGNIRHYTGEPKGFRNIFDINEDVLTGNISTGTKQASLNDKTERLMSIYEDSKISSFEPYPGQRLITCKIQKINGIDKLLFQFWKPATFGGIDVTPTQLNDYIECTKTIISDLQFKSANQSTIAPEPRIFFDITSTTGNTFSILNKIMLLNSPRSQMTTGIGDYIGTGVSGSNALNEDTVQFDLSMNFSFKNSISNYSPWTPSLECIDNPQPTVINPAPPLSFVARSRVNVLIPQTVYTLSDINSLGLGATYAQNFTTFLKLYSVFKGYGTFGGVVNYINSSEINTEYIEVVFEINYGTDSTNWDTVIFKTLREMSFELLSQSESLTTIKNKKGHDNIINPSLIPCAEHPILNPYASSYMPKYLSYTDSEKIKKTGTEFIDLKEDGTYGIYVSPGILANDLFVSYLNKEDINTLVNQYNDPSLGGLQKNKREIPEYFGSTTPPDGTEITYLQKIEVIEDPPRRPDNLVFYQSDYNGFCTKISSDGNTYAVSQGRMFGDEYETGTRISGNTRVRRPGLVRVYKKNNGVWSLSKIFRAPNSKLSVFPRGHMWNVSNGYNGHVDLSADGNRIVIGAAGGFNNYFNTYDYDSSTDKWISRDEAFSNTMPPSVGPGQTLVSSTASGVQDITNGNLPANYTFGSEFGSTLSLSADGNRIVLIKLDHPQQPDWTKRHCVKIYDWDSNSLEWVENSYEHNVELNAINHPGSIALSGDGKTYVIGNPSPRENEVYYITVGKIASGNGNVYTLDGMTAQSVYIRRGCTYVFDWSFDNTHPLRFSQTPDGIHGGGVEYTTGVIVDTVAYTTTFTVTSGYGPGEAGLGIFDLYYYCGNHPNMGGQIYYTSESNTLNVYRLDEPQEGQIRKWRWLWHGDGKETRGDGKSVTINYDGSRFAVGNVDYDIGTGRIDIYDIDSNGMVNLISQQYGDQNSFLGYSLSFNRDGTKLAAGSPYGFSDENPLKKTISRDETNNLFLTNQIQSSVNGLSFTVNTIQYGESGLFEDWRYNIAGGIGSSNPTLNLFEGYIYVFDWSSNGSHPFLFSTTPNGTHSGGTEYTDGVTVDYGLSTTTITIQPGQTTLYYYSGNNSLGSTAGGQINISDGSTSNPHVYSMGYDFNFLQQSYYMIGEHTAPTIELVVGKTYEFNWQPNELRFSTTSDGTHVTGGVEYTNGVTVDTAAYKTTITVQPDEVTLYYYQQNYSGSGGQININHTTPFRQETDNGRLNVLHNRNKPNDPFEFQASQDANAKYIKDRGGAFYDTRLGQVTDWRTSESSASLGMRSERQRVANGFVNVYEYISGNWENVLKMDASSGEKNENDQKSWPGTYGEYGIYKGTADGLGISVSMNGDGTSIISGAPLMSTIGKIQEKLDWYPGGGMTAAYSISEGQNNIDEGDPVSSVLLADTSRRSHTRETEEEVGRSYVFNLDVYKYNETLTPSEKDINSRPMTFTDGYNIVNDAQRRLNHDITDFVNLPEIGKPIKWDKQFTSVPDGANYPPLKGDYQNPEWADSDLKSKVDFPLLDIIKKIEIIVNDKVWQTIENADLLSIYSTEMTESLYNTVLSNSTGRSLSDGTRKENTNEKWIPGKSYNITIPIPSFTSSVESRFNNFTDNSENGFLAGILDNSKFKSRFTVKVYYNEVENIWNTNNVSAMQGYTAPIYTVPHVTTKIEDGYYNGNPSSLIEHGARYETTGKSLGKGLYVTNVPQPWNPEISFNSKMYGQKIIMNREEMNVMKKAYNGITKKIKLSKSINKRFINVRNSKIVSVNLDELSIYTSHLIINVKYINAFTIPYLKTVRLFLNSKSHSILEGAFIRGISNKSLGLYSNQYNSDKREFNSNNCYVYPLANKAFGGSSISLSKYDSIRLELIFDCHTVLGSDITLSDAIDVNVTARGLGSVIYKDGLAIMQY